MGVMLLTASLTFLGIFGLASSGYSWGPSVQNKGWPLSGPTPEFESTPQTIVVSPGQTAVLPCRVRNLADKVVSWIRQKDLHIISSGSFIFTGDSRFQVLHPEGDSSAWGLQLRKPEHKDQGLYECQINTDPKLKRAVLLTVAERPSVMDLSQKDDSNVYGSETASIHGPKERYVKVGSSMRLVCQLTLHKSYKGPSRQPLAEWLHDNNPLGFRASGGGVRVDTQKEGNDVMSQLTLEAVQHSDSGTYTCRSYHSRPATVLLYVIDGEHSEAMQGDYSGSLSTFQPSWIAVITLFPALRFPFA